jgi:hypothetical protein
MTKSLPSAAVPVLPVELTAPRRETRALSWVLAAAAGLSLGACQKADEESNAGKPAASSPSGDKECCHGKNACKGKGGCAVPGKNDCAGKNACKGQGGCNMNCPK